MFDLLDMGASGLTAQRIRMDTISANIAGMDVTTDAAGRNIPYQRRFVLMAPGAPDDPSKPGVHVQQVALDTSPFLRKFQPGNPAADPEGYVNYPNVDLAVENVNAMEASRAYEANISIMETAKAMINSELRLLA